LKLDELKNIYFLGIGGIGMSALARWFNHNGYAVSGYDKTPTPLTDELEQEGIYVHFEDSLKEVPQEVLKDKAHTLVVYTPAIPVEHQVKDYLQAQGYEMLKRSKVLGLLTEQMFTVAVAGTHGKTTTSSMIAHLLKASGLDCAAFLGGIAQNYNTNMLINEKKGAETIVVVEADEFDRSFLALHPNIAVVTSADADHLDIYKDKHDLENAFKDFIGQVVDGGEVYVQNKIKDMLASAHENRLKVNAYGLEGGAYRAENLHVAKGAFVFDAVGPDFRFDKLELYVPGFHNVENALAAIAVGHRLKIGEDKIRRAIATFGGVKRRFEYVYRSEDLVFIDDYAHHPVEIEAFLKSVRALYPEKKITAVFQPHLYTRTRDFAEGFSESLSLADEVYLLDIYPAREKPIEGVSSQIIFDKLTSPQKTLCSKEQLLEALKDQKPEVIVTIGAGDIAQLVDKIKKQLRITD
jgi:UDP-N-acetylmuramate--alanine ligase